MRQRYEYIEAEGRGYLESEDWIYIKTEGREY